MLGALPLYCTLSGFVDEWLILPLAIFWLLQSTQYHVDKDSKLAFALSTSLRLAVAHLLTVREVY
jgi:hypothetical protein